MDIHCAPPGLSTQATSCHGLVAVDLAMWDPPYNVFLFHYTVDIMLTSEFLFSLREASPPLVA